MHTSAPSTSARFWFIAVLAGLLTWTIHELMHFQMGRWLGYEMWVSLNRAGLVEGTYQSTAHDIAVTMAGPAITYIQALVALVLIYRKNAVLAYPFLFFAWFMRTVAMGISFISPNDEARTSLDLGLPMWALPALAVTVLLAMTILGSRHLKLTWKTNALLYLLASLITAAIVFADPVVGRILEG